MTPIKKLIILYMVVMVGLILGIFSPGMRRYLCIGSLIAISSIFLVWLLGYYGIIDRFKGELVGSFIFMVWGIFSIILGLVSRTTRDKIFFIPFGIFLIILSLYFVSRLLRG